MHAVKPGASCIAMIGTSLSTKGGISSVVRTYRDEGIFDRWRVRYFDTHGDGTRWRKLWIMLAALVRFAACLLTDRPALAHIHVASRASFWRKLVFFSMARLLRVPVILHVHGGAFERFYTTGSAWSTQPLVRWMLRDASHVLVLSARARAFVRRVAPQAAVTVFPNPVTLPGVPRDVQPGLISFLGRLSRPKGVFELLEAFAIVAAAHPQARLHLAGEGERDAVLARARELGIAERVSLPGWVDGIDKDRLLAASALFVLPSHVEGMPVCVLEAMAHGVPVVATAVGGVPDLVDDGVEGLLVAPGDAQALARALGTLFDDPARAQALGGNAHARILRQFQAPLVCRRLEDLYVGVLAGTGRACPVP